MSHTPMSPAPDLFDQWAMSAAAAAPVVEHATEPPPPDATVHQTTPAPLRRAVQELVRQGLLEAEAKPQAFRHIAADTARVNALLEPLDLEVRVDDTRGLAYVAVASSYATDDEGQDSDEWTHPLVRRQRLTLDQSLLLAILRREFLQQEQERGMGMPVFTTLEQLLPQMEIYLGASGSDMQDRKRLLALLENLRTHGVVSEPDAQESLQIRPMIVHLANPHNLQNLLQHLRAMTAPRTRQESPDAAE